MKYNNTKSAGTKQSNKKRPNYYKLIALSLAVIIAIAVLIPACDGGGTYIPPKQTQEQYEHQQVDLESLLIADDLRGSGLSGYWVQKHIMDFDENIIENTDETFVMFFDEVDFCSLAYFDPLYHGAYDEYMGGYDEEEFTLYDTISEEAIVFFYEIVDGDLYIVGEDSEIVYVFAGPYDEEALLYQSIEYYKAASFATSALLESEENYLSYDQWNSAVTASAASFKTLERFSLALGYAADNYLLTAEFEQEPDEGGGVGDVGRFALGDFFVRTAHAAEYDTQEAYGVVARAQQGQKIKTLASHFNVTAKQAYEILLEMQSEIDEQTFEDEEFYGKCLAGALRIKNSSKVGLLICGMAASGGTLSLLEGGVMVVQGADVALEINEDEAFISYDINGKQSAAKSLDVVRRLRSVTAPASSIVGLKGLSGSGFDRFMVLKDAMFDAADGKVLAIKVTDQALGQLQVTQLIPQQVDDWKAQNGGGYKLTEQDKQEVWAEILELTDQMEIEEDNKDTEEIVQTEQPIQTQTQEASFEWVLYDVVETDFTGEHFYGDYSYDISPNSLSYVSDMVRSPDPNNRSIVSTAEISWDDFKESYSCGEIYEFSASGWWQANRENVSDSCGIIISAHGEYEGSYAPQITMTSSTGAPAYDFFMLDYLNHTTGDATYSMHFPECYGNETYFKIVLKTTQGEASVMLYYKLEQVG